jgi:hypothetical protein
VGEKEMSLLSKILSSLFVIGLVTSLVAFWFSIADFEKKIKEAYIKKEDIIFETSEYNTTKEIWKIDLH